MKKLIVVSLVAGLALAACKKKDEPKPGPGAATPGPAAGTTTPATTGTAAAPAAKPGSDEPTSGPADALSVTHAMFAAFNDGRLEEAAAFVTDDYEDRNAVTPDQAAKGREAIIKVWQGLKAAFSNLRVAAKRVFDAGSVWVVQAVAHGTHTGEFRGIKATGEKVGWEFLRYAQVEGGKLKRSVVYTPTMTVLRQLKAVSGPGGNIPPIPAWPEKAEVVTGEGPQANVDGLVAVRKALNERKWAAAEALSGPGFMFTNVATGQRSTMAEQKGNFDKMLKVFPDAAFSDEVVIGVGDYVISRLIFTGTHKGDLGPFKASGKPVATHGVDVVKFQGGKVVGVEAYRDASEMLTQIGAFSIGAPAKETPKK